MTSPIDPTSFLAAQPEPTTAVRKRDDAGEGRSTLLDTLDTSSISEQAQIKYQDYLKAQAEEAQKNKSQSAPSWQSLFGLQNGSRTLDNGNRQVVTIDGSNLLVQEFDGDKLIMSMEGEISAAGVLLDTEIYNDRGEVVQTLRTQMDFLENEGDTSLAHVSRNVQWFEDGELTRSMRDSMDLRSTYLGQGGGSDTMAANLDGGTVNVDGLMEIDGVAAADLEELAGQVTVDQHDIKYFLTVQDYDNGRLVQDMTVSQHGAYKNKTNRSDDRVDGMDPHTTREISHDTALTVDVRSYDANGDLLRSVSFSDSSFDGTGDQDGMTRQSLDVSWYNRGELVKRSHGSLTVEEAEGVRGGVSRRQSLLESLRLKEEDYATSQAQSAQALLGQNLVDMGSDAEQFATPLRRQASRGSYDSAEHIAKYGAGNHPYSISWTNEVYRDGELALRQVDKESARMNHQDKGLSFRKAGALTEDDTPATLRSSFHSEESFENGRTTNKAEIKSREFLETDAHGPDRIGTFTQASQGTGMDKKDVQRTTMSRLGGLDGQAHAAAEAMAVEVDLTIDDLAGDLRGLNPSWMM